MKFKPNGFPGQTNRGETPSQILPHIIFSLYSRIPREYKYTQLHIVRVHIVVEYICIHVEFSSREKNNVWKNLRKVYHRGWFARESR